MTYQVLLTDSAFSDLENIKSFIAKDSPANAKNYIARIFDRLEQLERSSNSGHVIANSLFDYAKAHYLVCVNHVAIYQINELGKCVYVLRVLSHYQDWKSIVDKDIMQRMHVIAENENLQIARMNHAMVYDVYRNSQDESNRKYVPDEVFGSLEEASEAVKQITANYESEDGPFVYAIIRRKDHANMGYVQLYKVDPGWEIGYHVAQIYAGNGYATEAVNLFLEHIKSRGGIKQVAATALAANKASRRVLEKCGFETVYEGSGLYQGAKRKIIKTIKRL